MTNSEPVLCANCGGVVARPTRSPKLPLGTKRWCTKRPCQNDRQREIYRARRDGVLA